MESVLLSTLSDSAVAFGTDVRSMNKKQNRTKLADRLIKLYTTDCPKVSDLGGLGVQVRQTVAGTSRSTTYSFSDSAPSGSPIGRSTVEREREARNATRRDQLFERRATFQRETLLALQEAASDLGRATGRISHLDTMAVRTTGKTQLLPED